VEKREVLGKKPVSVPLCQPQIQRGLGEVIHLKIIMIIARLYKYSNKHSRNIERGIYFG
jgi:hypothetical protein